MSQAQELLQEITKVGVSVCLDIDDCDTLRIEAPRGVVTDTIKDKLAEHKQEILKILRDRLKAPCQTCQYHDTGPDTFGTSIIHWCGPFKEPDGTRWLNIAELAACPLGKWGDTSKTVH
jgi:hypothetical protein